MGSVPTANDRAASRRRRLTTAIRESLRELTVQLSLLNHHVSARVALNDVDLDCLDLINRHGPVSPSALARRAGLHPATITGILDRLERGGWVARDRDPSDRRAVAVRALRDRNAELFGLYAGMNASMDEICAGYTASELEVLADFLRRTAAAGRDATDDLARDRSPAPPLLAGTRPTTEGEWENGPVMDAGVHLPLIDFGGEGFSRRRLTETVDAALECGFAAISANDHFLFSAPWLDGPTALAAVAEHSGGMKLMTSLALATLRGPVPVAKMLAALDILSDGRVIAGVGPGSSKADYAAVGTPFEQRWQRFDEAVRLLKALLQPEAATEDGAYYSAPPAGLSPSPRQRGGVPLWLGSWGSQAGLRRVARLGDGWLASAYNTTPEAFAAALALLGSELSRQRRPPGGFPHALVTMWTWITDRRSEAERVLSDIVAPLVGRDPAELRGLICVGSAQECAELLSRYARAGCQRIHFWPVGDERRQIELIAGEVMPRVAR